MHNPFSKAFSSKFYLFFTCNLMVDSWSLNNSPTFFEKFHGNWWYLGEVLSSSNPLIPALDHLLIVAWANLDLLVENLTLTNMFYIADLSLFFRIHLSFWRLLDQLCWFLTKELFLLLQAFWVLRYFGRNKQNFKFKD